ncbi:PadR family transcriptional regulator [Blastococcus sp. TF02A-26]|uniref:PadR family transcriptional regulator n=1 Tax=Blastococcus sp. TF02A-26 TaxID=2250577 RepID=UPI000DE927B7|nr:PadR family transcriptional regulator [Blastococcus sp. TF02A-26]RBY84391.1 PadR family transcriptional regulator [Blastococcus sp. TF02A-26]
MVEPSSTADAPGEGLPTTAYTVLGILATLDEELTAAEIKKRCDYTLRWFYWSPAVSHIRRELFRLRDLGLVTEREVPLGRSRRSVVYRATARGEELVRRWAAAPAVDEPVVLKDPALLRVYFGHFTEPHELVAVLDGRLAQLEEQIADLVWSRRRMQELGLDAEPELRHRLALGEYLLRAAHAEQGNVRQLRDRIADADPERPGLQVSRPRGELRRRPAGPPS